MEYRTLGKTGLRVSVLGFGAATVGDEYGTTDPTEVHRAVHLAIDRGINFFDVAPYYGRTLAERRLGEILEGRRHQVVLGTKCARYDLNEFDFSAGRVTRSIEESLTRLRTDYLDIFHVHDIEFGDRRQIIEETVPALRRLQEQGKTRFIGITGLAVHMLRDVAESVPVDCILSYCRYNLLNTDMAAVLGPLAERTGIGLINASPLHMRVLTEAGPPAWHLSGPEERKAAAQIVRIAKEHGSNITDISLQFAMTAPAASTFNGLSNCAEVEQNLKAIEKPLDPELLKQIEKIAVPVRGRIWPSGRPENYDPQMKANDADPVPHPLSDKK